MGFVHTFGALAALRFVMGAVEAGLFPGIIYLTSMYYRRFEYQKRMTAIWSAILLSSSISGVSVILLNPRRLNSNYQYTTVAGIWDCAP